MNPTYLIIAAVMAVTAVLLWKAMHTIRNMLLIRARDKSIRRVLGRKRKLNNIMDHFNMDWDSLRAAIADMNPAIRRKFMETVDNADINDQYDVLMLPTPQYELLQ